MSLTNIICNSSIIFQSIRYCSVLNILYLNNPKVACSTIKKTLWELSHLKNKNVNINNIIRDLHKTSDNYLEIPITKKLHDLKEDTMIFSMVRNPYIRVLSSYLDKIKNKNDQQMFNSLKKNFDLSYDISFKDFLIKLSNTNYFNLNDHFRPQSINLNLPFLKIHKVFKLEKFDDFKLFIYSYSDIDFKIKSHAPHSTNSKNLILDYYDDECLLYVQKLFKVDFINFNYNLEISNNFFGQSVDLSKKEFYQSSFSLLKYFDKFSNTNF